MAKIKMLKTAKGSPDGLEVISYLEGQTYEVGDDLMMAFFEMGACERVDIEGGDTASKPADTGAAKPKKK